MTPDVGFCINEFTLVELLPVFDLFVREHDVSAESLGHQQVFAKSAGTSSQHVVRVSWDDGAKRKYEVVNLDHVQKVSRNRIRN